MLLPLLLLFQRAGEGPEGGEGQEGWERGSVGGGEGFSRRGWGDSEGGKRGRCRRRGE